MITYLLFSIAHARTYKRKGRIGMAPWLKITLQAACLFLIIVSASWVVLSFVRKDRNHPLSHSERLISVILFVIGGVPLLTYPFVMLGNMMTLAGHWSADATASAKLSVFLFIALSSAYPFTYHACVQYYRKTQNNLAISLVPIIHLAVTILYVIIGLEWSK